MDDLSYGVSAQTTVDDIGIQRPGRDALVMSAQLRLSSLATPVTVRIRNLSAGGLMAEFSGRAGVGDAIEVDIRGIGWVSGRIAWIAEGRMGIALDNDIDPRLAHDARSTLQLI
ncbi:PilZ domain-containing protein [Sphingomonas floccifaciens]|uniref:PilZ domain-containing protein n=1 Tax=Sphingomonas floccifaciens TaxID=1844115 RepID=A0ABW4NFH3_9SPHN